MEHIISRFTEPVQYMNFQIVAQMLERNAFEKGTGTRFYVGETYLDFGQDWKWTTILAHNEAKHSEWQALSPRDWKNIYFASDVHELASAAWEIMEDKYFIA